MYIVVVTLTSPTQSNRGIAAIEAHSKRIKVLLVRINKEKKDQVVSRPSVAHCDLTRR